MHYFYPITQRLPIRTSAANGPEPVVPNGILHSETQQLPSLTPPPPLIPSVHFKVIPFVGSTCARIDELTFLVVVRKVLLPSRSR